MNSLTRKIKKIRRRITKSPYGWYGTYVQLSRSRGIKLLSYEYDTYEEARFGRAYSLALTEAYNLKRAKKRYHFIPECYAVRILKIGSYYTVGIEMQHLGDKVLQDLPHKSQMAPSGSHWVDELKYKLRELGIEHCDLHGKNVMHHRSKYWVIDFGMAEIHALI